MGTRGTTVAVALAAGILIGILTTTGVDRSTPSLAVGDATARAGAAATVGLPGFTDLVRRLAPSVVNISTESEEAETMRRKSDLGRSFDFYFRGPRRSLGSGFILDSDGYIVTNHHVVEGASKIVVKLSDQTEFEVGTDAKTDLAVIRIESDHPLPALELGDSDALSVGEWVLAIGNPFGLDNSVTAGIVSAKGRRINRRNPYDDFIQTDAAINPGNSGGPLVNLAGQVVGVNSAIFSSGGGNIGIGFAIPINMGRDIVPQLKEFGLVTRGWLGVKIQPVDEDIARILDLPLAKGALVAEIFPDSPAALAGMEIRDVIVEFDGIEIAKSSELPSVVAATKVDSSVAVKIVREGELMSLTVKVAKLEDRGSEPQAVRAETLGMSVQDLTDDIRGELELDESVAGVVVSSVITGSSAEAAGIRPGDVIEMIGNDPVTSAEEFSERMGKASRSESILVLVRRGAQTLFRVIKPSQD